MGSRLTKSSAATAAHVSILLHRATIQDVLFSDVTLSVPYKNSSSKTNGIATASENGHPTIAPVANANVLIIVRRKFLLLAGSIECEKAIAFAYMANDDGRNADTNVKAVTKDSCKERTC